MFLGLESPFDIGRAVGLNFTKGYRFLVRVDAARLAALRAFHPPSLLPGRSNHTSPPFSTTPATLVEAVHDLARSSRSVTSASLVWLKS